MAARKTSQIHSMTGAIELVKLVRGGMRDHIGRNIIELTSADAYIGTLYARLRDELRRVLDLDEP